MTALAAIQQGSNYGDVRQTFNIILGRLFDVKLFGAKGDGTTDDTAAIDAAVAALTAKSRGTLYFPPGVYPYAGQRIRLSTSDTWVEGPGAELLFTNSSTDTYLGRLLFDGGYASGTIRNVGVRGAGLTLRESAARDYSHTTMNDPLGNHPYSSMVCSLSLRGCADFLVDGGTYIRAPGWTIHLIRCQDGKVTRTLCRDAVADGIHLDYGCTNVQVVDNHLYNLGDDGIAVGFTGAACSNILIARNSGRIIGGKLVAIYGAESGTTDEITAEGNDLDGSYLSGIGIVALGYGGSGDSTKLGPIGTVRLRGGSLRNAGMAPGISRGVDQAHGIYIQPSGSTIAKVLAQDLSISKYRNAGFFVSGAGLARLVVDGLDVDTQSATGAAAATSSGGAQAAPSSTAPIDILAATNVQARGCTVDGARIADVDQGGAAGLGATIASDDFNRSNGVLGSTPTGGKAWTAFTGGGGVPSVVSSKAAFAASQSYPQVGIDVARSDADITAEVTFGATPMFIIASMSASGDTGIVFTTAGGAGGGGVLYAVVSGSGNGQPSAAFAALTAGTYTLRVKRKGTVVTAYVNGTQVAAITLPAGFSTNTRFGVGVYGASVGTETFDNFVVRNA